MANPNPEHEANQAIVAAAREALLKAAANLTPELEAAAIYALRPHTLPEELSDGDDE